MLDALCNLDWLVIIARKKNNNTGKDSRRYGHESSHASVDSLLYYDTFSSHNYFIFRHQMHQDEYLRTLVEAMQMD